MVKHWYIFRGDDVMIACIHGAINDVFDSIREDYDLEEFSMIHIDMATDTEIEEIEKTTVKENMEDTVDIIVLRYREE